MPELPEVETIKRELRACLIGKRISGVLVINSMVIKLPGKSEFIRRVKNCRILDILRKGKALIIKLQTAAKAIKFLVIHLRMSGQLIYPGGGKKARVSFKFSDGSMLDYNDQRLLGELKLVDNWQDLSFFKRLGPEPFGLSSNNFFNMLCAKKSKIKQLIMDQSFIAGIGNIYAAEALFKARLSPEREAKSLSRRESDNLLAAIKYILNRAIKLKGSSIDQYRRSSGKKGGFADEHKVYGREDEPCFICKEPIKRIALSGRGTYFCRGCQK